MNELTGLLIGFVLTLLIFSNLLGDNPLYKIATHLLVGVSAGYAALITLRQVLGPAYTQIQNNPASVTNLILLVPLFFAALLLLQRLPTIAWLGNTTLALIIGIGAAVSLVGAFMGTIVPLLTTPSAATRFPGQGIVVAVLTAVTLLSFRFTSRHREQVAWTPSGWQNSLQFAGRIVLTITFGFLFAASLNTSMAILAERLGFFIDEFIRLIL